MVTTAFVGAGMVAAIATQTLPSDLKASGGAIDLAEAEAAAALDAERLAAIDNQAASRSNDRGAAQVVGQKGNDLWLIPVKGRYDVSSSFGMRWGAAHRGVDLACPEGTPIVAPSEGKVTLARWYGGYGNAVMIDHGDGVVTLYGHNSRLIVREGQLVRAGEVISHCGNTGYSYGAHLHFEVHINGTAIDPVPFMRTRGVNLNTKSEVANGGRV